MVNGKVLFIVEGEKDEPKLIRTINDALHFTGNIEIYSYKTSIHELYEELSFDDDLELPLVLRAKATDRLSKELLSNDFTAIYLIFDFEPHYPKFDIYNLIKMQKFFNSSLDRGLLLINYPMLESFKHLNNLPDKEFLTKKVSKEEVTKYKEIVGQESKHYDQTKYHNLLVKEIMIHHLIKMNMLINNKKEIPTSDEMESMICDYEFTEKQYENYLKDKLYVLSTMFYYLIELMPKSFYEELQLPVVEILTKK